MIRTLSTWLTAGLMGGALLTGCGSSSSSSSNSTPATTGATTTTSSTSSSNPAVAAAVAACKSGVQHASTLSQSTKQKIEGVCEKAASGDKEAARKAAQEVCEELINSSPLPSSSAKEEALKSCKTK